MAPYILESFLTTVDHVNLHFPTIYIVSQQHILRDLFRGYNSFWFILCEQIFWDTIFRGEWRIGKWVETLESGCKLHEVTGKIFKTEKQKKKGLSASNTLNYLLISWKIFGWMLQIPLFLNHCTKMWEGRKTFWKGVMWLPLLFCALLLLGLIFKPHLANITCPGHYKICKYGRYTFVVYYYYACNIICGWERWIL